jgi:hypothetical protein
MPDGVSYEGVFGERDRQLVAAKSAPQAAAPVADAARIAGFRGAGNLGFAPESVRREALAEPFVDEGREAELRSKLDDGLQGLADKVAKDGTNGTLSLDEVRVVDHRVDVMVYLRDIKPETLAALEKLGFKRNGEAKSANVLIGSIAVDKLEELEKLEAVLRVAPVNA